MTISPTQYVTAFSDFQEEMERAVTKAVQSAFAASGVGRSGDVDAAREALAYGLADLVALYGPQAESFGMYLFGEMTGEAAQAATIVEPTQSVVSSTFGILSKYAAPLSVLAGSMTRHTMNYSRSAIHNSAAGVPGMAYARVPSYRGQRRGKGPCEFCIVLASRGAVYADSVTAGARGSGNEYHDDCYCVPTVMRKANPEYGDFGSPSDWPKGYNPSRLYEEIYSPSHDSADTIRDVTRKIREKDPTFPLGR